jgi:hypothetical protein
LRNAESKRVDHFTGQKDGWGRGSIDDSNAGKRNDGGNEKGHSATEPIGDRAGTDGANHGSDLSECVPQALPIRRNKILAIAVYKLEIDSRSEIWENLLERFKSEAE